MREEEVQALLQKVNEGTVSVESALGTLRHLPIEDIGFARLDVHRELRQGLPEAIYAAGKRTDEVVTIAEKLIERTSSPVLATRCREETSAALAERFPDAEVHERARLVVLRRAEVTLGSVAVACAGTSDLAVAEEALGTAAALGASTRLIIDVGVAGLHRVLSVQDELHEADVIIVVAGMEGALASLIGGITRAPVIAVPTSVGYGASFEGIAALLAMLNSCAAGVTVTNIDNGFGAAIAAVRILNGLAR